jgi:putative metallohydrolase (TIGR04338 family)
VSSQTEAVYAAEDAWVAAWAADPAAESANLRFGTWQDAKPFVEAVMARVNARRADDGVAPLAVPRVRARKGALKAHYDPATRTIALPTFEAGGTWALNQATVLHELAHHLDPEAGHGPSFRTTFVELLETLGWLHVAELLRTAFARIDAGRASESLLDKISKLLAHAEKAGTTAERDTYLAKAETLATEHSIDLARARAGRADRSGAAAPTTREIDLRLAGGPRLRNLLVVLAFHIAHSQGIQATVHGNHLVTFYGFTEDLDVTDALFVHLAPMMMRDSDAYLASPRHKRSGFHGASARISYCRAWAAEVGRRLNEAREATQEAAVTAELPGGQAGVSTAVALREKQLQLDDYVAYEFKHRGVRGTWTGPQTSDWSEPAATAGKRDGARASLSDRKALPA